MNSKGAIGGVLMLIVVTVTIVGLLLLFVFGSSFIKKLDNVRGEVSVMDEDVVGIGDVFNYMVEYSEIVDARVNLAEAENG